MSDDTEKRSSPIITRREAVAGLAGATGLLLVGCDPVRPTTLAGKAENRMATTTAKRMPTVFLPHGGGPWPFTAQPLFGDAGMWDAMEKYMTGLSMVPPEKPKAILLVSAHWEAPVPTVMTAANPPMLYDYYGFPEETYEVQWPAPGEPEVAQLVRDHLEKAGFKTSADDQRGFDHGTFVPLKLAYPNAEVPTFQLSLKAGLNPVEHFRMGQALAPLRDQGVFIVGSGMSYHNMRAFQMNMRGGAPSMTADSKAFDDWLAETVDLAASQRETRLVEWEKAPAARASHPREEHLLPLHVIAGAAADDRGSSPYRDKVMGAHVSAVHFG